MNTHFHCSEESEHKQRLNLSPYANAILEHDIHAFNAKTRSGLINIIIKNFYNDARASISITEKNLKDKYNEKLSSIDEPTRSQVIDTLVEDYTNQTLKTIDAYESGCPLTFRINNENFEYLTTDCTEAKNYSSTGKYIKALIEEYATLGYGEREKIFFADLFKKINEALDNNRRLKLQLGYAEPSEPTQVNLRPLRIEVDPISMYHYIVGQIDKSDQNFSYRISNLKRVTPYGNSSFLSKETRKNLSKEIAEKSPVFMEDELKEIHVYLTDEGIRKFNRILHLRPRPVTTLMDKNAPHHYVFHCTTRQIRYYFVRFGADAIILSPEELRNEFIDIFNKGIENYSKYH